MFYTLAMFAPFVAPYPQEAMDRQRLLPSAIDAALARCSGPASPLFRWCARHAWAISRSFAYEEIEGSERPLRLLRARRAATGCSGSSRADRHLFGVDAPARVYLLGTDSFGRDQFSRLLYGAQISLTVGLVGIAISFTLGLLLGGISGYFGGIIDTVIMRITELLLSIPSLYLIIALRAVFPIDLPSQQIYLGIVTILAFIGWAGLARVIRGIVLSIRKNEFVTAAEALGVGRFRLIARHILPNTMSFVIVAATVSVPSYILGEVVLSFLGVGVQEPAASWGNMLNQARSIRALTSFPWLLYVPATAIFLTVMAFNFLGDGLRDALDPRRAGGTPSMSDAPLLRVSGLQTHFFTDDGVVRAVDDVSFEVGAGETLAVVGESGSGKSVTALSILRLISQPGRIVGGAIVYKDRNLLTLSPSEMRAIRGDEISMIFQEPMTSLNPVFTCGEQIIETLIVHERLAAAPRASRAIEMLELVGIPAPGQRVDEYPHQTGPNPPPKAPIGLPKAADPLPAAKADGWGDPAGDFRLRLRQHDGKLKVGETPNLVCDLKYTGKEKRQLFSLPEGARGRAGRPVVHVAPRRVVRQARHRPRPGQRARRLAGRPPGLAVAQLAQQAGRGRPGHRRLSRSA